MRIAVTGTHGTGKSTLIEDFVRAFPGYRQVQEPYLEVQQDATVFVDGATSADLEEQLVLSSALILGAGQEADVIFDRCPIDFLGYLDIVSRGEGFEWEPDGKLLAKIEKAVASLDLLVFLPLSSPDEIDVPIEFPKLRKRVDLRLKAIVREDELALLEAGPALLEVRGSRNSRVEQVARKAGLV